MKNEPIFEYRVAVRNKGVLTSTISRSFLFARNDPIKKIFSPPIHFQHEHYIMLCNYWMHKRIGNVYRIATDRSPMCIISGASDRTSNTNSIGLMWFGAEEKSVKIKQTFRFNFLLLLPMLKVSSDRY